MKKLTALILGLIVFLAFLLRFVDLAKYPEAIDEDEMALGYYGFSLAKNGTDEYGNKLPIYFPSVGDYKYGLYSYFAAIPISIFGLNSTSTRITAALAGTLTVVVVYFLALEILPSSVFALASAFFLAIDPTHIHFSRVAYNNVLGGLFAFVSVLFFLRWLKSKTKTHYFLSLGSFILAIYSYQSYRIFLPVSLLASYSVLAFKAKRIEFSKLALVLVFVGVTLISFIPKASRARSQTAADLFNLPKITEQHSEDGLAGSPLIISRFFHNKIVSAVRTYAGHYFSYFDPNFLFLETSANSDRQATPDVGLLNLADIIFLAAGTLGLFLLVKTRLKYIPVILLLASPLAASLVNADRSTTRAVMITVPFALFCGMGFHYLFKTIKYKKLFLTVFLLAYLVSTGYFVHQYFVHKPLHMPWYSDYGLQQMVQKVNNLSDNYDKVVISRGHYIPFLYFNRINPQDFITKATFSQIGNLKKVEGYGKLVFNMPYDCPPVGKVNVLYVCFGYKIPATARLVDLIRFRDGQPAILLVDFGKEINKALPERVEREKSGSAAGGLDKATLPIVSGFWP